MITQAIKSWLSKLFVWWPWKHSTQINYTHIDGPLNKGTTHGTLSRSAIDGVASQPGIAQRRSTIEEWPESVVPPPSQASSSTPPPMISQPATSEFPETPHGLPLNPPIEQGADVFASGASLASGSPQEPTSERQLEFLQYLIKRGIVNEGFEEGKIPEQYRREES